MLFATRAATAMLAALLVASGVASANDRIDLRLDTSEADAVLAIVDKRLADAPVTSADWEHLFETVPYHRLKEREASMNRARSWCDDAPMESFLGTLKSERVHSSLYRDRAEATTDLFYYIEGRYNRWRLHSSLAYESPEVFEQLYHQRQEVGLTPCSRK